VATTDKGRCLYFTAAATVTFPLNLAGVGDVFTLAIGNASLSYAGAAGVNFYRGGSVVNSFSHPRYQGSRVVCVAANTYWVME
jgi:hypothetical protein